jgi:CelD/BcsL family acetyltransferase involved in cellulose biosynthesis
MVLMVNTLITPSELIEWFRCLLQETRTERRKKALEERGKLKISVVRPGELGPGEIAVWLSMQRQTPALANPFLCPDFTLAVGSLRSCARVAVLHDGPQLAGFFPFERRGLSVGVPIGHGLNQRQGLIHAPGAEWDPKALLRACRLSAWQFDNLVADQPPLGRFATEVVPVAAVDLARGFAHYEEELQQKSGKFYREIKRKTRRLEEEVGKVHFVADSSDKTALDSLVNWKSEQLRQKGSLDIFTRPWITGLLDQLFSVKADHFSMPLSVLYAGETPISSTVNLRSGDLLVGWHTAYNPQFAHYSPGLMHHIAMFRDAAVAGVRRIDMGTGTETFKRTLKTHDEFVGAGTAAASPTLGAAHRARAAATLWARGQVKRYPPLFRAADLVLRQTGRIG